MSFDPFEFAYRRLQADRDRERMQMQAGRDSRNAQNAENREDRIANGQAFNESLKIANELNDTAIQGENLRIAQEKHATGVNADIAKLFAANAASQKGAWYDLTGTDSGYDTDRIAYGQTAMQRYVNTPEAKSLMRVMGFANDPSGFAAAIDSMAGGVADQANSISSGNVPVLEKSYEGALTKAHQVATVADTLGIKSPLRALSQYSKYNSADNPHADLQRLAVDSRDILPATRSALGSEAAMAKVNEMAGGDALKAVGMQNQAAYTLQSLAKDLGVDPTTLAAAVSKSPELLDTFMQRFSQASGNSEQAKMLDAQTGPTMQDFALANANLRNAALRTGRPATFGISPGIMPR